MTAFPEYITVASIVVICYLVGLGVKISPLDDKYIPLIVGVCGAILGVIGMHVIPEFPGDNILDAIAVGIASGLAATGAHQAVHQFTKDSVVITAPEEDPENTEESEYLGHH